jgi:AraC-like DNA-binding protein
VAIAREQPSAAAFLGESPEVLTQQVENKEKAAPSDDQLRTDSTNENFHEGGRSVPTHDLIKLRMDRGGQLLLDTSMSVTDIALSAGCPDIYSFTRAYPRHFGEPPGFARKLHTP